MRIGVVSDTHGNSKFFRAALKQMGQIDLLIHAGDHYQDAVAMGREAGVEIIAVAGNCDWSVPGRCEVELELEGYRVLVTHGHLYGAKSGNAKLIEKLKQGKYDLIIYGHSHMPEITHLPEGFLLNPGSLASPRGASSRSYGVVEISKGGIIPYIHDLKW